MTLGVREVAFGQILKSFVCCAMEFTLFHINEMDDECVALKN